MSTLTTGVGPAGVVPKGGGSDTARRLWLLGMFAALPVAIGLWVPPHFWLPLLWLVAACAWVITRMEAPVPSNIWARVQWRSVAPELRRIGTRFILATAILVGAVALFAPRRLFDWPLQRPWGWLGVLALYPALSVFPQELLYRRFFFRRARTLIHTEDGLVFASAVMFGAMHAIFQNPIAVALSLIGGWLFADTYRRTGSLRLVCFEHALYGCMIFTVGLGDFFSHWAIGK
jgi:uncharacterized protein